MPSLHFFLFIPYPFHIGRSVPRPFVLSPLELPGPNSETFGWWRQEISFGPEARGTVGQSTIINNTSVAAPMRVLSIIHHPQSIGTSSNNHWPYNQGKFPVQIRHFWEEQDNNSHLDRNTTVVAALTTGTPRVLSASIEPSLSQFIFLDTSVYWKERLVMEDRKRPVHIDDFCRKRYEFEIGEFLLWKITINRWPQRCTSCR